MSNIDRLPPHNRDAEEAVLGSILIDPDALLTIDQLVDGEAFYFEQHRIVFEAIKALVAANEPIDFVTLSSTLNNMAQFERVGGEAFLIDLLNAVPTSINAESYARLVDGTWKRREMIRVAGMIANLAYDEAESVEQQIDAGQEAMLALNDTATTDYTQEAPAYVDGAAARIATADEVGFVGLSTGNKAIDKQIGGLGAGEVHVVAAVTKTGKSFMTWQWGLHNALNADKVVAGFDLEMTQADIAIRWLSMMSGTEYDDIRRGYFRTAQQRERYNDALEKLKGMKFPIRSERGISPAKIRAELRRIQAKYGRVDMAVLDYWQLMSANNPKISDTTQGLETISKDIKRLAGDFNIPIVIGAQINNKQVDAAHSKRPKPSMMSRSDALIKDADGIHTLFNWDNYEDVIGPSDWPGLVEFETHPSRKTNGGRCYVKNNLHLGHFAEVTMGVLEL